MPRPLFTPAKDPVPNVQEAGWATGPVWTGAENLTPTWIQSPYRPAHSQSLYRLSYPAPVHLLGYKSTATCFSTKMPSSENYHNKRIQANMPIKVLPHLSAVTKPLKC